MHAFDSAASPGAIRDCDSDAVMGRSAFVYYWCMPHGHFEARSLHCLTALDKAAEVHDDMGHFTLCQTLRESLLLAASASVGSLAARGAEAARVTSTLPASTSGAVVVAVTLRVALSSAKTSQGALPFAASLGPVDL